MGTTRMIGSRPIGTRYPDVVQNSESLVEAIQNVDERQKEDRIDKGFPDTSYDVYEEPGEKPLRKNVLREMAAERGQDSDNI